MIAALINWSVRNRFLVILMSVLLAGASFFAVKNARLDAIPDLSDVQVIIKTSYPGQTPQVVEDQVTYPLTTAMLSVPGAETVRGYSFFGDSYVYIIFADGTDIYWARSRVLEYLSQVAPDLPAAARSALGPDATGVGWVYQYALVDHSGQYDLADLRSIQDWFFKYELQTVPGVAEVATIGGMVREYQVVVDPNRLRAYGIPLARVHMAIKNGNQESGGSVIEMAEAEYMVRASGYIQSISDLESIPLGHSATGTPIRLSEVATVRMGPQLRRGVGELNGKGEVVGGVIIMRYGENAYATIQAVKARIATLKSSLPDGVELVETYDRSSLIERAVANLNESLIQEFVIVALICALFLFHLRSAMVVVVSLPLGIGAAFVIMNAQGINANIMSLGGIAIAIGTMVDAAIVQIENFHKKVEKFGLTPENRWKLVAETATEVGPPLFFSLLIMTLSFLPIFALEAQEGRLFAPLAYTKTYSMIAATILSVTLVPVLIGLFVRGRILPEERNPINRILRRLYRPLLSTSLNHPWAVLIGASLLVVSTLVPLDRIGSEFMPDLDEGDLLYMPSAFPAVSIGKASQILQQTNKLIMTVPEVESVHGKVGRADTATDPAPLTMIESTIKLKPHSEWRDGVTMDSIRAELNAAVQVPSLTNVWTMPIRARIDMLATGIKTPVGIKIAGPDLNAISQIGEQVEAVISGVEGTASVYSERVTGGRFIDVDVDREAAARYGMNIADVQAIVRSAIGGMVVTETVEGLERYPVNLRYPREVRNSVEQLKALPVVTSSGAHIPLGRIANIAISDGPGMIRSENARPNGWVYVDIVGRDLGSYVQDAQAAVAAGIKLPAGYSLSWSGQYEYMERAKEKLTLLVPIAIIVIVILLYLNFHNLMSVVIILGTLPMSLVGGLWLLDILGHNFSVAAGAGFIALAGVAVEIGVIMIVYLDQAYQENREARPSLSEDDVRQSVMDGALLRVRPIMMTVGATIAGLLPIMFGSGTGSEVMQRIAAPMVGGMISAAALALLVIPAAYFLWKRWDIRQNS